MNDLAQTTAFSGEVRLYDLNHESAQQNERLGEHVQNRDDAVGRWTYRAVRDLETALDGVEFVIFSTQDLPAETFRYGLELPAEYGIYQSVGDTVGPGGVFRALRSILQYRAIAAAVREYCPDVWVLNYTNPMTVCTRTLYEKFPDVNAVGLCHEIYGVQRWFFELIDDYLDVEDVSGAEFDLRVKGINHFT